MALTPESYAKESEHSHQVALFIWAARNAHNDPRLKLLFAVPNGGERNKVVASSMVAEGAKSGVPDTFLPVARIVIEQVGSGVSRPEHYHGLFVEMKKPSAKLKRGPNGPGPWDYGGVSDKQKEWLDDLTKQGYKCVVCYSWLEAANEIKRYLTGSDLDGRP